MVALGSRTHESQILNVHNPYLTDKATISTSNTNRKLLRRRIGLGRTALRLPGVMKQSTTPLKQQKFRQRSIDSINQPPVSRLSNVPHGDHITDPKADGHCRIVGINPCGLKATDSEPFSKVIEIGESAIATDTDIVALPEPNKNMRNVHEVLTPMKSIIRKYWSASKLATSSSADRNNQSTILRGGTATIVGGTCVGRIKSVESDDLLGRWNCVTMTGKHDTKFTVMTAYQVNPGHQSSQPTGSAFMQQYRILNRNNKSEKKKDPRVEFWKDCKAKLKALQSQGHEVLLIIDSNDPKRTEVTNMVREAKMQDLYILRHGSDNEPETYQRGTERIDFMFGTSRVAQATRKAGIGAYHEFCTSDHRHSFVDIDIDWLLGCKAPTIVAPDRRVLQTSSPRHMTKYLEHLEKVVEDLQLVQRHKELFESITAAKGLKPHHKEELNYLDKLLTEAKLEAERKCAKLATLPWSPDLIHARRRLRFWNLWKSELLTNRNFSEQRLKVSAGVDGIIDVTNPTVTEINRQIRHAHKALMETAATAKERREKYLEE